jgi:hypothetical protein
MPVGEGCGRSEVSLPADHADPDQTDAGVNRMVISLIATSLKRLGAVCLIFVILWHVVLHAGPQEGTAIVHVSRPDVDVSIDNRSYHVDSMEESPLVCELPPGVHEVKVSVDGLILGEESFTVEPGKEVVMSPITRAAAKLAASGAGGTGPASESNRREGLAVHVRKHAAVRH